MKVIILAGSFGTRLEEETYLRPKPMIEIGGRPILWRITKINYAKLPLRKSDQKVFVANIKKAKKLINRQPKVDKFTGIKKMLKWIQEE